MYKNIVLIITNYYYYILKNSLQVLNLFNKSDIEYIVSYIKKTNNSDIDEYSKNIQKILSNSINNLSKEKILYKIDFFFNSKIFPMIDKTIYINPINIINQDKISLDLLNIFFKTILYDAILELYLSKHKYILYYKKYDTLKLNSEENFLKIYKYIDYLEKDITYFYKNLYLPFYFNILNKLDKNVDYIFPMIIENNILVSGVINDKNLNICDDECVDVIKNNDQVQQIAGANTDIIKYKLEELYNEPYIKNLYTKSEIENLETILNNKKLNKLIKQKKIKLSKNFQEILKNVVENKNKDFKDLNDYVKQIFIVQDNKENIDIDKIADIINSSAPDNKKFLEYLVDKIVYNEHVNNHDNKEIVSMIDNIFDKILNHNYDHNSLNLENEDIKFILMLETLNTLKSKNLPSPASNITLNVYKDINKAKVNNDEIRIDY